MSLLPAFIFQYEYMPYINHKNRLAGTSLDGPRSLSSGLSMLDLSSMLK